MLTRPVGGTARTRSTTRTRRSAVALTGVAALLALAACSGDAGTGGEATPSDTDTTGEAAGTVTLVTHDSFDVDEEVLAAFEASSGLTVALIAPGDGGALVNQLILTKDSPLGDAVFGIDNTFATRAIDEGVLEPYTPEGLSDSAAAYDVDGTGSLTAIDVGDVCLNVDHVWFAEQGLDEPTTFEDLLEPEYEDLTVVTNAATSSPGLAFLLATVGHFGEDGWEDYWQGLVDNGVKVADGWSDAYYVDFSGVEGGPRPIVLSYSTSPAFTLTDDGSESTTGALLDTCFRQVEYAGVLAGAQNPEGARALLDFLVSESFQAGIPDTMYMYPADSDVALPDGWAEFAPLADQPVEVEPAEITANRDEWIRTWTEIVTG